MNSGKMEDDAYRRSLTTDKMKHHAYRRSLTTEMKFIANKTGTLSNG